MIQIDIDILDPNIELDLSTTDELEVEISQGSGSMLPMYDGSYIVVPTKQEQILNTKNKSMADDVTIHAINRSETSNPEGGKTIVIGFE